LNFALYTQAECCNTLGTYLFPSRWAHTGDKNTHINSNFRKPCMFHNTFFF
jgi:hypothetical protein